MATDVLSYELAKTIQLIPGYDPVATAADGEWFDEEAAKFTLNFWRDCLTFSQGAKVGQPFILEPWEEAIVANLWGWKRADGTRRYRRGFIFVARGNGKSEIAAGCVCTVLYLDHQPGAQILSAAAKLDQTRYVFDPVTKMIAREPEMLRRADLMKSTITVGAFPDMKSYRAICAAASGEHGGATHAAFVDELHAHASRELLDVIDTSTGKVAQPLVLMFSTSDFDREGSVCNTEHDYASKIRDGIIEESSYLPVIYEASNDDDWTDPEVWKKANPNYGVTVTEEYLAQQCRKAQEMPEFENTFKRLHLNIRTQQAFRWMPMHKWDACDGPIDLAMLKGRPCWGGLDLASTIDLASLVLAFDLEPDIALLPFFWCPEETAEIRERKDRQPYLTWSRQGLVTLTPGASIDYRYIRKQANELSKEYKIQEIGFDPWNATHICQQLAEEDGIEMVEFRQGLVSMNAPMKQLMKLVIDGTIRHGGHKVLRWNMNNLAARTDASDNVRPDKEHSFEKIDGAVAAIMAVGMLTAGGGAVVSPYETGNVRWLC